VTAPENFVSRWARLKRNSDAELNADAAGKESRLEPIARTESIPAPNQSDVADEPFDTASLPPVDTITFDTDIRGFLQSRVPAALTRAALRQAWASDPAIRDFIGIAENQWDFNDPTAMPGFGPMLETDNLPALLTQALGRRDELTAMISENPLPVEQTFSAVSDREHTESDRSVRQTFDDSSPSNTGVQTPRADGAGEAAAVQDDEVLEQEDAPPNHRSHGSALPR
jgi:Protein of unknown function (DUF3306)